jgi:hypothetical protein
MRKRTETPIPARSPRSTSRKTVKRKVEAHTMASDSDLCA